MWYLSVFDPSILAAIALRLLSHSDCLKLLQQLRKGDPEWEQTVESLPNVTPNDPNMLVYLLSSLPSDVDGPLPLAGSETAKKVGFTVNLKKRQLYGGSAFAGADKVMEDLHEDGVTKIGKVLEKEKVMKGETTETGGGFRVHGQHLVRFLPCSLSSVEYLTHSSLSSRYL